jgi:hypothetical protein
MHRIILLTCLLLGGHFFNGTLQAQINIEDSVVLAGLVDVEYGAVFPAGDLADRFGFHSDLGMHVLIKNKKNLIWGFGADFFFGNSIRDDSIILDGLKNENGFLLGTDGFIHDPLLLMRGFSFSLQAGKVIPIGSPAKPNMNSGLVITGGAGFIQHKISIQGEIDYLPQLSPEFQKGYDRLANGLFISQYIGFLSLGKTKFVNIRAGLEFRESFTAPRRDFNIDTGEIPSGRRIDIQMAAKIAWVLPIYEQPKVRYYYD